MEHTKSDVVKPLTLPEAVARHQEILEHTESVLKRWVLIVGINFITHFMRMAVVLAYMTDDLNASKLSAGGVVTAHLTIIGLANAYLSYSIDNHSFETMITARFGLLTLFTLGEWLAQNFIQFAIIYIIASLAIVWLSVSDAYFVQMLPPASAKSLSVLATSVNRGCIMVGLVCGGLIGGFISLNAVFLGSFIITAISLMFILIFIVGRENNLKSMQQNEIARIYREFPEDFDDINMRFPIPWNRPKVNNYMSDDDDDKKQQSVDDNSISEISLDPSLSGYSLTDPPPDLDCTGSVPLFFLLINSGLRSAQIVEIIAWWNVYATEVFDVSIAKSTGQMVVAALCGIPALFLFSRLFGANAMPLTSLLSNSIIAYVLTGIIIAFLYVFVFPSLSFKSFWIAFPAMFVIGSTVDPFHLAFQVVEAPPNKAGWVFVLTILSRSVIPAVQHIIIGALWSYGGSDHPWFWYWFAVLQGISTVMFLCYWVAKGYQIHSYQEVRDFSEVRPSQSHSALQSQIRSSQSRSSKSYSQSRSQNPSRSGVSSTYQKVP